jgi:hypothetical protein
VQVLSRRRLRVHPPDSKDSKTGVAAHQRVYFVVQVRAKGLVSIRMLSRAPTLIPEEWAAARRCVAFTSALAITYPPTSLSLLHCVPVPRRASKWRCRLCT